MSNMYESRPGKPVVGHKAIGRPPIGRPPSPRSAPSVKAAPAARPAPPLTVASAGGFRIDPANATNIPSNDARPAGDEIDVRMAEIDGILRHAAMHCLQKCLLAAEWVHHAETKLSVLGQPVHKPGGGRPEGGLTRAARELCVPGATPAARRKYLDRAIKIAEIWPEAKSKAETAGLDDIQSALLAVARESSLAGQLAKVQEIAARKAMPRRKSTRRNRGEGTAVASAKLHSTMSNDSPNDRNEPAVAPTDALAPKAVATTELFGPSAPPPSDDDIPAFLDRRPLSAEDQRIFDAIMTALHSASAVVRERVRAALKAADQSTGVGAAIMPAQSLARQTANVEPTQAPRTKRVPGDFEDLPF
jgi:hypothetical protein